MKDFTFTVPQTVIFGTGSSQKLPDILKQAKASKVLIVSDRGLEKAGIVERIATSIRTAGLECVSFLDILPNPTVEMVEQAVQIFAENKADFIVAVGGGSPMDVAKAVAVVARYGGSIVDYEGGGRVPGAVVPIAAIPTTAGTGSESTAFSVITDTARNYKLTVFSYEIIPTYAILDATLIFSLPHSVAAATGVDAAIHAIEAYLSRAASPFSDAMAEKAMELIGGSLRAFVACREDIAAAEAMLAGSMFAGIAFAWARLGNVHAMSHPLSAHFHLPHGVANAVLLPIILEYNKLADTGRYSRIEQFFFGQSQLGDSRSLAEKMSELLQQLGISTHLSDYGVKENQIGVMAADAMKSGNIMTNPRQSTQQDIEMLYHRAM